MTRQLKGLLYLQAANGKHSISIFWSILISTSLVSFLIAALTMGSEDVQMVISFSAAIYIQAIFIGFNSAKKDVGYALRLGATRKNIFMSTGIYFFGFAFISALFLSIVHQLITFMKSALNVDSYQLMHPASLLGDTWLNRLVIDTSVMFFFLTLLFLFGLLFYRYGLIGGGSFGAALVILMLVALGTGWLQDALQKLSQNLSMTFFFEVLGIGIAVYLINWFLLRRITILTKS